MLSNLDYLNTIENSGFTETTFTLPQSIVCCNQDRNGLPKQTKTRLQIMSYLISSAICPRLQRSAPVKSWLSKDIFISSHSSASGSMYLCTSRYYFCYTVNCLWNLTLTSRIKPVPLSYNCLQQGNLHCAECILAISSKFVTLHYSISQHNISMCHNWSIILFKSNTYIVDLHHQS